MIRRTCLNESHSDTFPIHVISYHGFKQQQLAVAGLTQHLVLNVNTLKSGVFMPSSWTFFWRTCLCFVNRVEQPWRAPKMVQLAAVSSWTSLTGRC